jgi:hypothetical protein
MRIMALVFTTMMAVGLANSASAARYSTEPSRDHQFVNGCGGGSCYRSGSQKIQHPKHHKVVK